MSYAARVSEGIVVEVVELPEGVEIGDAFHPDVGFIDCPASVSVGMLYAAGEFLPAPEPEPPSETEIKAGLLAHARDKRWQIEVGGILIAGVPIATDDRSKIMIVGARVAAQSDPGWSTVWQGADGVAYPLNAAAMIGISDAVQAHVNSTFAALATIAAAIEAGAITTREAVNAAFDAPSP